MTKEHPPREGKKAFICRNCGLDPFFERDDEFTNAECPRCGETTRIKGVPLGPP